jgi:hypothetical protein
LALSVQELRDHFPEATTAEVEASLNELAPKTRKFLEGKIKVPLHSDAWPRPLSAHSQKFDRSATRIGPLAKLRAICQTKSEIWELQAEGIVDA